MYFNRNNLFRSRIESLKKDLDDARQKLDEKNLTLTTTNEELDLTQKWQIENAKMQKVKGFSFTVK
jgi:hypothetical protein